MHLTVSRIRFKHQSGQPEKVLLVPVWMIVIVLEPFFIKGLSIECKAKSVDDEGDRR
jgi:hypothetical protein